MKRVSEVRWAVMAALALALCLPGLVSAEDDPLRDQVRQLNSVLGDDEQAEKVKELAKNPAEAKKLLAVAVKMAGEKADRFNFSSANILATLALELHEWDAGNRFYAIAVERAKLQRNMRRLVIAYLSWVDLLTQAKRYPEAERKCQEILELDGDEDSGYLPLGKAYALRSLVQIAALQGKFKEAFRKLERVDEDVPFHKETRAWLLHFTGKYEEAAELYQELLRRLDPDDDNLKREREKYARILGGLYGDMGDLERATKALRPLLRRNPDDAGLNNDLGYIWADLNHNLEEAERMIKKALDKEPDNASFLDSYGWVLYRLGKKTEAKKYLQRAAEAPRGQNIEILHHYGEVLWSLGEREQAQAVWKKALEVATPSHRDQQRKKEIEKVLSGGSGGKDGP
jgi:tetratricopeptide (TPR) repeat protein